MSLHIQKSFGRLKFTRFHPLLYAGEFLGTCLLVALGTAALHLFKSFLAVQYIALLYLLPVMIATVLWGLAFGILAAFLSFLSFNYYFIQPYNTLVVHHSQDVITLIIFLGIAIVMSQLIGQARKGMQMARLREWEATKMYELISDLAGLTDVNAMIKVLAEKTLQTFNFSRVEVTVPAWADEPTAGYLATVVSENPLQKVPPTAEMQLSTARGGQGKMVLWYSQRSLSPEENRLLNAYCDQGALAIERIHLILGDNKTKVLEESDKVKTALLNSVSHELRSPLAAIKASVSSLRIGAVDWDSDQRQELLTTVEEETDMLNQLVGNLLDMSRIEAGALNPQKKWNSIAEIVNSVLNRKRITTKNHPVILDLPETLPLIPTDFVMMEQVFTNLISNGVKYAPENTPINITADVEEKFLLIRVENHSQPVPDVFLEHIFDKFFRVTQADRITGTGLGLSICKGIIEAHGGKIWAENMQNGFRFCFTLPLTLNGEHPGLPTENS